jgi:hypothetical protein
VRRVAVLAAAGALGLLLLGGAALAGRRANAHALHEPAETAGPPSLQAAAPPSPREPAFAEPAPPGPTGLPPLAEESAAPAEVVLKRRQGRTEKELLEEIARTPSVGLDRSPTRAESNVMIEAARWARATGEGNGDTTLAEVALRDDLAGLPLRRGRACRLSPPVAARFDQCAAELRGKASDAEALRALTAHTKADQWLTPQDVPVLMQVLMAEASPVREVLVERLAYIKGLVATAALAQIALFDLHPKVRERAVRQLARRPAAYSQAALLRGFEHPWTVVADHAAEAVVALRMKRAVPDLVRLLERPDPRVAYSKDNTDRFFVKEVVRVNHLRNCLLCHPPSFEEQDRVRGRVPSTDEALDADSRRYYGPAPNRVFVRADVTYLKQDLSAMLPVASPGPWPALQRFDFFVRERAATPDEILAAVPCPKAGPHHHQRAVLFALRELTGRDLGPRPADWKKAVVISR